MGCVFREYSRKTDSMDVVLMNAVVNLTSPQCTSPYFRWAAISLNYKKVTVLQSVALNLVTKQLKLVNLRQIKVASHNIRDTKVGECVLLWQTLGLFLYAPLHLPQRIKG